MMVEKEKKNERNPNKIIHVLKLKGDSFKAIETVDMVRFVRSQDNEKKHTLTKTTNERETTHSQPSVVVE